MQLGDGGTLVVEGFEVDAEGEGVDEAAGVVLDYPGGVVVGVLEDAAGFGPLGEVVEVGAGGFAEVEAGDGGLGFGVAVAERDGLWFLGFSERGDVAPRDVEDGLGLLVDDECDGV